MTQLTQYQGYALPLDLANIDTDAIIPKQFLQKVTRSGFGAHLFHNWRYLDPQGKIKNPDFILNQPDYANATILVGGENFGCGSSREHAPWALLDYGFRIIIAPSFADIFYNNAFNNQMLLITLPIAEIQQLIQQVYDVPKTLLTVNLEQQYISIGEAHHSFVIEPFKRHCLLHNLDHIALTLQHEDKITEYEQRIPKFYQ